MVYRAGWPAAEAAAGEGLSCSNPCRRLELADVGRGLDWLKAKGRVLAFVPLLLLVGDLVFFPPLLVDGVSPTVAVASALVHDRGSLGRFHAHEVMVDVSSVTSKSYLSFLRHRSRVGVVISAFATKGKGLGLGALGRAVLARLKEASPATAGELTRYLATASGFRPGDIHDQPVPAANRRREDFPIDMIYVAVMQPHDSDADDPNPFFEKLFKSILSRADKGKVEAVVIPPIGFNWEDNRTYEMNDFYRALLTAINDTPGESAVDIELFDGWPTAILERAIAAINVSTEQIKPTPVTARVARWAPRLMFALCSICLFVCSFWIPLNAKNLFIVCVGFVVMCLGEKEGLEMFFGEVSGWPHDLIFLAAYSFTAILFPLLAQWDPKELFSGKGGGA